MLIFFYDFETSGLPLFDQPSDDPRQPHIVQAAAALMDAETRKTAGSLNLIARPDGWEIPDEAAEVHGITTDYARKVGVPEDALTRALHSLWARADLRVAHNQSFDARIMRIALKRFMGEEVADTWKAGNAECTQKLATPIVKAPPTDKMLSVGRKHVKNASLSEACEHFTGQPLQDAHSALADVKACISVWCAVKNLEAAEAPASSKTAPPPPVTPVAAAADDDGVSFLS